MESRIGLDYIVENSDYTHKLAKALDCDNITVKKQVFELLSALCVYNSEGYVRALQALEQYKEYKCERYRLKLIVEELSLKENPLDYKATLLVLVNCLIISIPQLKDRVRIRNEFIGLKLLAVLDDIRRYASKGNCSNYAELAVQLDVFQEQKENDESQILDSPYGVDLNSHVDVFYAIFRQVAETPQEIPFLNILQHLLRIDPKEAISDIIWDTAEKVVHRATLLESRQDATRILRSPSVQSRLCCHNHRSIPDTVCGCRKQSLNIPTSPNTLTSPTPAHALPSPTNSNLSPPPPPPPPPPPSHTESTETIGSEIKMGAPSAPPPPIAQQEKSRFDPEPMDMADLRLPQQETPTPKTKMKTINWNKIPNNKVVGKHNIWFLVARSHQHAPMTDLDWSEMEGLFCQQVLPITGPGMQSSPKLGGRDLNESYERRRRESPEIILLDGKRSLNVNIFLKQFRCSNEDIIQIIKDGEHDDIGAEKLKGLLKMLPEIDELEMLKSFDGDKSKLANAEKFLLQLIAVSNYKLRIESMLLKEEFPSSMSYLEPSINSMIVAGEDLMTNKPLQEVLYMVICAGNFLNSGGYAGNAAGVKLSSLQKLTDIRANKPGMNLIHFVALQIEKKCKDLIKFADEMSALDDASKSTVEQLQNEVQALNNRIQKIKKHVESPSTEVEIKNQMREFLRIAELEVGGLKEDLKELESVRKSLAEFFCEDPTSFKIEECFKIFHNFCVKFKQAVAENERRRAQEEQANARRQQREEQLAKKRNLLSASIVSPIGTTTISNNGSIMDILLSDIEPSSFQKQLCDRDNRKIGMNGNIIFPKEESQSATNSPLVGRRRLGSYSGDPSQLGCTKEGTCSPDITPTGSLRRRRSRVPSEEDETALMDFLKSGEQGGSMKERKSWGSLDRSWARRVTGGRKRPNLLNADFSIDRERPASPSPIHENKSLLPTPEQETKPKAWRQKIEAWLQENEEEEKLSSDSLSSAQKLNFNSPRSMENDTEYEGKESSLHDNVTRLKKDSLTKIQEKSLVYQRVYSDWKPTIEKTDIVGTMEAIADIQPQSDITRRSQINSSWALDNSENGNSRKLRRMRSSGSIDASLQLEAIKEEERKKNLNTHSNVGTKSSKLFSHRAENINEQPSLPPFPPRKISSKRNDFEVIDKIEIDSDNIETPPATRKLFGSIRKAKDEEECLGDGQFDRFSSARRTRRYRKSLDQDTPKEVVLPAEKPAVRPTTLKVTPQSADLLEGTQLNKSDAHKQSNIVPKKVIAIKNKIPVLQSLRNSRLSATLPYSFKNRTPVDSVKNKLKSEFNTRYEQGPTFTHQMTPSFTSEIKIRATTPTKGRLEHDLHDEGFEETQSLISDSPSQTTSSGCNFDIDNIDSPPLSALNSSCDSKQLFLSRTDSSGSGDVASGCDPKLNYSNKSSSKPVQNKLEASDSLLPKRTNSLKIQKPSTANEPMKSLKSPNIARNLNYINKPFTTNGTSFPRYTKENTTPARLKLPNSMAVKSESRTLIQRYPSKSSLKSSRSSLNSCASVSTVKTIPPSKLENNYSKVIKSLTSIQQAAAGKGAQTKSKKPLAPIPAKVRMNSSTMAVRNDASNSESKIYQNGLLTSKEHLADITNEQLIKSSQSFMRPTASSSAKDTTDLKPKFNVKTPFK